MYIYTYIKSTIPVFFLVLKKKKFCPVRWEANYTIKQQQVSFTKGDGSKLKSQIQNPPTMQKET